MKEILKKSPEILLIIGVLVFWFETTLFNPIAITLLILLALSLRKENKIIKMVTSIIFGLLSVFMLFAVISEFSEFETGSSEGLKLLFIGSSIFIVTLVLSVIIGMKGVVKVS